MKYIATVGAQEFTITINDYNHIEIDGERFPVNFHGLPGTPLYSLIIGGHSYDINIDEDDELFHVMLKGIIYEAKVEDERTRRLAGLKGNRDSSVGEVLLKAPMPGVIVSVLVKEGQAVAKGEIVIILESMKMQNEFKAPKDGVVSSVRVKSGDKIDQNTIMVTIS